MANRPSNFRQRRLTAAVKAMKKAGDTITKVEVDESGKLTLYVGTSNSVADEPQQDFWKEHRDAQQTALHQKFRRV